MFQFSLKRNDYLEPEIVHYYDSDKKDVILSQCNKFYLNLHNKEYFFIINLKWYFIYFVKFRILRRLFRLDKCNVVLNFKKNGAIIIYQKYIYFYCLKKKKLSIVSKLKNHRNVLHNSIAVTKNGIFFGEYGPNKYKTKVPVWASFNDGRSWKIIYNFPCKLIKHIHGIYNDPFENNLWITTGDLMESVIYLKFQIKNLVKLYGMETALKNGEL